MAGNVIGLDDFGSKDPLGLYKKPTTPKPDTGSTGSDIPDSYWDATRQSESGGDNNAKNPRSTATGPHQFLESTWTGLMRSHPELGLTPDGRTDPEQSDRAFRTFTEDNAKLLRQSGVSIDNGSLYAAHFLGAGGAVDALTASDDTPMSSVVSPEVVRANPFLADMTAGQFKSWASRKGGGSGVNTIVADGNYRPRDPMNLYPQSKAAADEGGMIELGNIDLSARPIHDNGDGTKSTVRSMSFEEDGVEVLVPTISPDGRALTDQQAIDLYHQTGQFLGKFASPDAANQFAQQLHEQQAQYLADTEAAGTKALYEKLNAESPGRYQMVEGGDVEDWQTDWKKKNGSDGIIGDTWRLLGMGQVGVEQSMRELVRQIPGVGPSLVAAGDNIDKWIYGKPSDQRYDELYTKDQAELTDETKAARDKKWWDEKNGTLGAAWLDPRSYYTGVVESIPGTLVTMVPAMQLARGAYAAALLKGATEKVAAAAAARSALFSGALLEGGMGGADTARAVRAEIAGMPREQLVASDAVQALLAQGMTEDQAIEAISSDAATQAFVAGGVATGMFGGFGDRFLAKIFAEGVGGSIGKRIAEGVARGVVSEGLLEEAPQSAGGQLAQNLAIKNTVDPNRDLSQGVADAALGGAAVGAAMGAGFGAGGGAARPRAEEVEPTAVQPPVARSAPVATAPKKGPLSGALEHGVVNATAPAVDMAALGEDLQPKAGSTVTMPPEADLPTVPAQYAGYPERGQRVIVDNADLGRFPAKIDDYVQADTDEGGTRLEAIVLKDDGEFVQVPATELHVTRLTQQLLDELESRENPPAEATPGEKTSEDDRTRVVRGRTMVMPDAVLASLYDIGKDRLSQKRLGRVLGDSPLAVREARHDDGNRVADALGVSRDRIYEIADDYHYRVQKAAREGSDRLPNKMHGLNKDKLKSWQAERARINAQPDLLDQAGDTAAPVAPTVDLDAAAHEAATSPMNDRPEPTQAQKEAGNYKMGHAILGGLDLSIENPAGSERKGIDRGGKEWSVTMKSHYGYIKGTEGKDKDHIDAFVAKGTEALADDAPVFVVDQVDANGKFDEHKVMLGYKESGQARRAYLANYTKGWKGLGAITPTTLGEFKQWLAGGDTKREFAKSAKSSVADAAPSDEAFYADKAFPDDRDEAAETIAAGERQRAQQATSTPKGKPEGGAVEVPPADLVRNERLHAAVFRFLNMNRAVEPLAEALAKDRKQAEIIALFNDHVGRYMPGAGGYDDRIDIEVRPNTLRVLMGDDDGNPIRSTFKGGALVKLLFWTLGSSAKYAEERAPADVGASRPLPNATAPEHAEVGVDDRELGAIVTEFKTAQADMMQGEHPVSNIFQPPAKKDVVRLADKVKVYNQQHGWMTPAEARAKIDEWKAAARAQGEDPAIRSANSDKVVLSLFDLSGEWSRPWEEAGYQVYRFDIQADPEVGDVNNFSAEFFGDWFGDFDGQDIYAVLAACPCTDFAVSGARHFAAKDADGRTVASVKLVHQTLRVIEYFKPAVWALENPVGRIQELGGLPPWRLSFDPNHLGDTYTKKTLIWGRFNGDLPIAPVEATEGSKMHRQYGGKSQATKNARSVTPEGFSYGFFMANNAHEHAAMAVANKFDRLDHGLITQAIDAGVKPDEIQHAVEDFYYMDLDDDAANDALRELIAAAEQGDDEAVDTQISTDGPWDFNDSYPMPDAAKVSARNNEGRVDFEPNQDGSFNPEQVAGALEEALQEIQVTTLDIADARKTIDGIRAGTVKLKKAPADEIKRLEASIAEDERSLADLAAAHLDVFPQSAVDALMAEGKRRADVELRQRDPAVERPRIPKAERKAEPAPKSLRIQPYPVEPGQHEIVEQFNEVIAWVNALPEGDWLPFAKEWGGATEIRRKLLNSNEVPKLFSQMKEDVVSAKARASDGATAKPAADTFAKNKLFTADKVDAARSRLKSKMGQLNSGIDPEVLIDGMTIAGAYIEAGVRNFADYAKAMTGDFGDGIKPYLLSFWEGARNYPGLDTAGMTSVADSARQHAELTKQLPVSEAPALGQELAAPKKRTPKTGKGGDRTLIQDFGVEHIDGWQGEGEETDFGIRGGVKDNFLKDATGYLRAVADILQQEGFTPPQDNKGRPMKAVGQNQSGVATSGDVSLNLWQPDTDARIYVHIAGTALRGSVPTTPSGISVMFRVGVSTDRHATGAWNQWAPVDLSATDFADMLRKAVDRAAAAKRGLSAEEKRRVIDELKDVVARPALAPLSETANEPRKLDQPGAAALEAAPASAVPAAEGGRNAEPGAAGSGRGDVSRDVGARGQRDATGRGVPAGEGVVPVSEGGDGRRAPSEPDTSDDGRSPSRPPRDLVTAATPAQDRAVNYTITDADELGAGGAKTKFRNNVAAIELLRELERANRPAKRDEQAVLAKWVGWGGLQAAFPRQDGSVVKGWEREAAQLKALLTPDEYRAAESSTRNAHYTSPEVVDAIWTIARQLGFRGGKVLEPSVGAGNFVGLMPAELRSGVAVTGVELDRVTGGIAKHLYPDANINAPVGFQDFAVPDGYFDLAIGNPPFGSEKLYDKQRRHLNGLSIHNYFFAKSVDGLRPGGLLAMVVTNYFLDAGTNPARDYIASQADLVGAIRLPNDAFLKNAGTEVTTDIIVLQKRGERSTSKPTWTETGSYRGKDGKSVALNRYFIEHPDMMLGDFGAYGTMYRGESAALVSREGQDLEADLKQAVAKLPADIMSPAVEPVRETVVVPMDVDSALVNSVFLTPEGAVMVRRPDSLGRTQAEPVSFPNEKAQQRVAGMIRVRDVFSRLRKAQLDDTSADHQVDTLRARLNTVYDTFVKAHGPIHAEANRRLMRDDPTWPQLAALEEKFDKGVSAAVAKSTGEAAREPSAQKAPIFSKRTQAPYARPTSASSAKDALTAVLNEVGRVDLDAMQRLYGKPIAEIVDELGSLLYRTPSGSYETADAYLSGNVKAKLAAAEQAAKRDPAFKRNVAALRDVIPADIEAVDIEVKPGSPWLPANHVADFLDHVVERKGGTATFSRANARWILNPANPTPAAEAQYGTNRVGVTEVLDAVMNARTISVYDVGADDKRILNQAATDAANEKAARLKAEWRRWLWEDDARRDELARLYNDTFNTDVIRQFDGSHLTLPGKVGDDIISFRPHQKNFVWRGMQTSTVLADHTVGAGKTFAAIALVMEKRRTGLAKKPMLVVPNHLVGQWAEDFIKLYPGAKVLAATKADFEKENRKKLFARIATGDWDAVIVAHSSFGKIAVHPDFEAKFIQQQIDDIEASERTLRDALGKDARNVKQLSKWRDSMQEKLKRLLDAGSKDVGLTFEDLGIDDLTVDEAHEFKNLGFATSMTRVAGLGNTAGSQKAADLYMKIQSVLQRTGGRNITFLTGTPISNTMAELFTVQRYLDNNALRDQGVAHFDAWANVFGEVVTDWELSPSGQYKLNSRFAKFVNMPELMQRYMSFADVITNDDIQRQLAAQGKRLPIPKVKGGKPQNVVVERSNDQAVFIGTPRRDEDGQERYPRGSLVWRAENLPKRVQKGDDNMLKVMSDARKAALDMRLIDPSYSDAPGSKAHVAADNMVRLYKKWHAQKGTQLVFIDLSTPKGAKAKEEARIRELIAAAEGGDEAAAEALDRISPDEILALGSAFSVYDDLREKLIKRGVPAGEIAFIHDANTDAQKQELFGKVRSGRMRFLFGSTPKMGAGTNVQNRLVALHHLDAPWRPSDLEQRDGRGIRQGNELYLEDPEGFEIEILRYATKNTLDARQWQTIEGKARFVQQMRKGDVKTRVIEDIAGEAANAAEMKAAASGNPLILEEMDLRQQVRRLEGLSAEHDREQHRIKGKLRSMREEAARLNDQMGDVDADAAMATEALDSGFPATIDGQRVEKAGQLGAAILAATRRMLDAVDIKPAELGTFGKFRMGAEMSHGKTFDITIDGAREHGLTIEDVEKQDNVGLGTSLLQLLRSLVKVPAARRERVAEIEKDTPALEKQIAAWPDAQKLADVKARHADVLAKLQPKQQPAATVAPPSAQPSIADEPVIEITGDELGVQFKSDADMTALRVAAERWYDANLRDTTALMADGTIVRFNRRGRNKSVSGKGDVLLRSIPAIRAIIERGSVVHREPSVKPGQIERLVVAAPVRFQGQTRYLAVSVHRTTDDNVQYDFTFDRERDGAGGPRLDRGSDVDPSANPGGDAAADTLNLREWPRDNKVPSGWGEVGDTVASSISDADRAEMLDIVREVSGLSDATFHRRIALPNGAPGWGRDTPTTAAGYYDPVADVIALAEDSATRRTAFHEAFHRLQRLFLTDAERKLLAAETGRLRRMIRSNEFRREQVAGMSQKELEAEAFALYATGKSRIQPHGGLRALWDRIARAARRVLNWASGHGYQISEDIFTKAMSGEVARRFPDTPEGDLQKVASLGRRVAADEVIDSAIAGKRHGEFERLAEALRPLVREVPVFLLADADFDAMNERWADGFFQADAHFVALRERRANNPQLVLHEMVHAAFMQATWTDAAVRSDLEALYRAAMDAGATRGAGKYAMTNIDEFVAEALTNAGFQRFLADTPANGGGTVFSRLVRRIRRWLGLPATEDTMLDEVVRVQGRLVDAAARTGVRMSPEAIETAALATEFSLPERAPVQPMTVDRQFPARQGPRVGRPANISAARVIDEVKGKLVDLQPALLKLIPLNYFPELAQPNMSAVQSYLRIKRDMDAYRGKKHAEADEIAQEWLKFSRLGFGLLPSKEGKALAEKLSSLMHEATLAGIDPSAVDEKQIGEARYEALRARFKELPKSGRDLFVKVRDAYVDQVLELDKLLLDAVRKAQQIARNKAQERYEAEIERINQSGLEGIELQNAVNDAGAAHAREMIQSGYAMKARVSRMRIAFEKTRVPAPYFPLARFGRYFVSVRGADGAVLSFSRREQAADRDRLAREMREAFPNAKVEVGVLDGSGAGIREQMDPRMVAEIEEILGGAGVDGSVMDQIWQRYLETMPDLSTRKRFIHRKGTQGFDADALRAFSSHMFHAAHQMGRIKYGLDLQEMTDQATIQGRAAADPTKGVTLANQLKRHHDWVMNPTGSSVAQIMTSTAFVWYLAASPAAALVNMTQTPMLGIPLLGARFGTGKTAAAMVRASADVFRGKGKSKLTEEEKWAMERFYESGLIDRTQAHDLAGVGENGIDYSPLRARVMALTSWMFHKAEVWNREVTALAAFRLAREKGQDAFAAVDTAHDLTWKVHFDYSNASRPAIMQNDLAKVVLVFRNHSINMLYRMIRDIRQAFKGETAQARKEARYQLAGILGMQALLGGVKGIFAFNVVMALLGLAFGNDDDPMDTEQQFTKFVQDALGPELAGIVLNGAPGHYLKVDLTSRIGMPDIWFRSPPKDLEGQDEFQYWVMQSLGATVGMAGDWKFAIDMAGAGKWDRALEAIAPKGARDLFKSARYLGNGVTNLAGDPLLEQSEIDPWTALSQAIGFTPAKVAETYERNNALKDAEQRILDRRRELLNQYAAAITLDDEEAKAGVLKRIKAFNAVPAHRPVAITKDTIRRSLATRRRLASKRVDGVLIQNNELGSVLRSELSEAVYR